jgi:hypothetical protein
LQKQIERTRTDAEKEIQSVKEWCNSELANAVKET